MLGPAVDNLQSYEIHIVIRLLYAKEMLWKYIANYARFKAKM
jgi:hypothetical protein